ncbi:MAG: adenylate kinase [Synergistaceae bacterium]|nr:adenylate kinase [Synergistaceae bacterium]MBQ6740047.1 adenylate kinase [Synergistaceae bacterium]MBQ6909234.1 adenylate kinase [Synergistaceae bacterium]MBQ9580815.1 adenylate kinase [Synergistaceae bacterium]MBR0044979.1 adenylate kinase [Synergistaceae bacterium]
MRLVLLGAPGAGKGTQAAFLRERNEGVHISTGDIFRKNLKEETPLGLEAKKYMDQGALVPDELVLKMVSARLSENDAAEAGFLLDGFPRTVAQAEFLEKFLSEHGKKLDAVLLFGVDDELLVSRLSNRRTCKACGGIFNLLAMNAHDDKHKCPSCGGELYQRDDDNEEVIRKRLKVFHEQTEPLIDFYKNKGLLKVVNAEAADTPEMVYDRVKAALNLK